MQIMEIVGQHSSDNVLMGLLNLKPFVHDIPPSLLVLQDVAIVSSYKISVVKDCN